MDAARSTVTINKVAAHLKQKGLTQTVNGWASFEELKAWDIGALPTTYIVGADGKIGIVSREQQLEDVITPLLTK